MSKRKILNNQNHCQAVEMQLRLIKELKKFRNFFHFFLFYYIFKQVFLADLELNKIYIKWSTHFNQEK